MRPFSSTRMGRRPCSSASMSLGLHWWNAPLQINRMWSVLTLPYFVLTCTQFDNTHQACMLRLPTISRGPMLMCKRRLYTSG